MADIDHAVKEAAEAMLLAAAEKLKAEDLFNQHMGAEVSKTLDYQKAMDAMAKEGTLFTDSAKVAEAENKILENQKKLYDHLTPEQQAVFTEKQAGMKPPVEQQLEETQKLKEEHATAFKAQQDAGRYPAGSEVEKAYAEEQKLLDKQIELLKEQKGHVDAYKKEHPAAERAEPEAAPVKAEGAGAPGVEGGDKAKKISEIEGILKGGLTEENIPVLLQKILELMQVQQAAAAETGQGQGSRSAGSDNQSIPGADGQTRPARGQESNPGAGVDEQQYKAAMDNIAKSFEDGKLGTGEMKQAQTDLATAQRFIEGKGDAATQDEKDQLQNIKNAQQALRGDDVQYAKEGLAEVASTHLEQKYDEAMERLKKKLEDGKLQENELKEMEKSGELATIKQYLNSTHAAGYELTGTEEAARATLNKPNADVGEMSTQLKALAEKHEPSVTPEKNMENAMDAIKGVLKQGEYENGPTLTFKELEQIKDNKDLAAVQKELEGKGSHLTDNERTMLAAVSAIRNGDLDVSEYKGKMEEILKAGEAIQKERAEAATKEGPATTQNVAHEETQKSVSEAMPKSEPAHESLYSTAARATVAADVGDYKASEHALKALSDLESKEGKPLSKEDLESAIGAMHDLKNAAEHATKTNRHVLYGDEKAINAEKQYYDAQIKELEKMRADLNEGKDVKLKEGFAAEQTEHAAKWLTHGRQTEEQVKEIFADRENHHKEIKPKLAPAGMGPELWTRPPEQQARTEEVGSRETTKGPQLAESVQEPVEKAKQDYAAAYKAEVKAETGKEPDKGDVDKAVQAKADEHKGESKADQAKNIKAEAEQLNGDANILNETRAAAEKLAREQVGADGKKLPEDDKDPDKDTVKKRGQQAVDGAATRLAHVDTIEDPKARAESRELAMKDFQKDNAEAKTTAEALHTEREKMRDELGKYADTLQKEGLLAGGADKRQEFIERAEANIARNMQKDGRDPNNPEHLQAASTGVAAANGQLQHDIPEIKANYEAYQAQKDAATKQRAAGELGDKDKHETAAQVNEKMANDIAQNMDEKFGELKGKIEKITGMKFATVAMSDGDSGSLPSQVPGGGKVKEQLSTGTGTPG